MKFFGKEIGKDIKVPPFIDNFVGKLLPNKHTDKEELVAVPSTNISDDQQTFELSIALPGLEKKDVFMEIQGHYLVIKGHVEKSHEEKHRNWVRTEFVSNSFYRAFQLPSDANTEKIEAKMKNGRLDIKIEKLQGADPKKRRIAIE